ncbi:GyrI-like domain-containing protein [Micromonospora sp. NPDC047527]|uniref:GyrI-like domain-containing protein n=1 Tax=Micromonospora sp. NPDC047527 TaxID=3155144 RepID=UPI0033D92B46
MRNRRHCDHAKGLDHRRVRHAESSERAEPGRIEVVDLPPVDLAVVVHVGPHDDIDVTYGRLGAWVVSHALGVAGPVDETYLVGPRDTGDPTRWRTELGWPVFRLTSG